MYTVGHGQLLQLTPESLWHTVLLWSLLLFVWPLVGAGRACCYWTVVVLGSVCWQNKEIHLMCAKLCLCTCLWIFLYVTLCVYIKLYVSSRDASTRNPSPPGSFYPPPCSSVTCLPNNEERGSHHPPSRHRILHFQCTCTVMWEHLTHSPTRSLLNN